MLEPQARGEESCAKGFGVVDAAMAVVKIGFVERMLMGKHAEHHCRLTMQAAGVGHGRANDAAGSEPRSGPAQNLDGFLDVLQNVAHDNGVEDRGGGEIFEQRPDHDGVRKAVAEAGAEGVRTFHQGEIGKGAGQGARHHSFGRSQFEAASSFPVAGEDFGAVFDGGRVKATFLHSTFLYTPFYTPLTIFYTPLTIDDGSGHESTHMVAGEAIFSRMRLAA